MCAVSRARLHFANNKQAAAICRTMTSLHLLARHVLCVRLNNKLIENLSSRKRLTQRVGINLQNATSLLCREQLCGQLRASQLFERAALYKLVGIAVEMFRHACVVPVGQLDQKDTFLTHTKKDENKNMYTLTHLPCVQYIIQFVILMTCARRLDGLGYFKSLPVCVVATAMVSHYRPPPPLPPLLRLILDVFARNSVHTDPQPRADPP